MPPNAGQDWGELARQVLRRVDGILVDNADPVKSLIGNLDIFSQVLARNSDRIDAILAGLERMTGGAAAKAALPIYDLAAPTSFPALAEAPHWQLLIPEPTIAACVQQRQDHRRSRRGRDNRAGGRQWSDNLPILFQEKVVQTFENAGFGAAVSRPRDGFTADYQLLLDIRRFVVATSPAPTAEIEFVAEDTRARRQDCRGADVRGDSTCHGDRARRRSRGAERSLRQGRLRTRAVGSGGDRKGERFLAERFIAE